MGYSLSDKLLHAFALNFKSVQAAAFDIERRLDRVDVDLIMQRPHIFITGLARAGTTILLQTLYNCGGFVTQTYRDMPFVLAPRLWSRISGRYRLKGELKERAHQDGLTINFDSVEAFEEVFWLTFAGDLYVRDDHLLAHKLDDDLISKFREYVAIVIKMRNETLDTGYLSKNNNNVLRLPGLVRAFPSASIIVPFREPFQHARSLLRQHQRAGVSQNEDPFELKYMRWLGHFEFGLDHRRFVFADESPTRSGDDVNRIDYWLENWTRVYRSVLATAPTQVVFWDYDAFCQNPYDRLDRLISRIKLENRPDLKDIAREIRPPLPHDGREEADTSVLMAAQETYGELRSRAGMLIT